MVQKIMWLPKLGRITVKLKDGTSVTHDDIVSAISSTGGPFPGDLRFSIMAPKTVIYKDGEWSEYFVERIK